jgi:hypothetical protein
VDDSAAGSTRIQLDARSLKHADRPLASVTTTQAATKGHAAERFRSQKESEFKGLGHSSIGMPFMAGASGKGAVRQNGDLTQTRRPIETMLEKRKHYSSGREEYGKL